MFVNCLYIQGHFSVLCVFWWINDTTERSYHNNYWRSLAHLMIYIYHFRTTSRLLTKRCSADVDYVSHLWWPHTPITDCPSRRQRTISMTARCITWHFAHLSREWYGYKKLMTVISVIYLFTCRSASCHCVLYYSLMCSCCSALDVPEQSRYKWRIYDFSKELRMWSLFRRWQRNKNIK